MRIKVFLFCMLLGVGVGISIPAHAEKLKGQAVTWANFSFINYIATSFKYVYFATTNGIIRYNKLEEKWEYPLTGSEGLEKSDILKIWVSTFDDHLIASTSDGLVEYDALFDRWIPVSELPVMESDDRHVNIPSNVSPPFGFLFDGRSLIDPLNRRFLINDVVDDRTGTLWLGIWGYGAARVNKMSHMMDFLPYGLLQDKVRTVIRVGDELWIGGAISNNIRSGITVFNPDENTFAYMEAGFGNGLPPLDVNCLAADDSLIFIGTERGVYLAERESKDVTPLAISRRDVNSRNVLCLERNGKKIFWGAERGLYLAEPPYDSVQFVRPDIFIEQIVYHLVIVDSSLWIASGSGAYRLNLTSGKLQQFKDPEQVLFHDVYDITTYGKDLWLISEDGVVRVNRETGEEKTFSLSSRRVMPRTIVVNDTVSFVGTDDGLFFIFYKDKKPFTRRFTVDDGLASNRIWCLLLDGDYLWVGTEKGLTRFLWNNPERVD